MMSDKSIIFKNASLYSRPLAYLEKGRLCIVRKCKNNWCKIETGNFKGWVEKKNLKEDFSYFLSTLKPKIYLVKNTRQNLLKVRLLHLLMLYRKLTSATNINTVIAIIK